LEYTVLIMIIVSVVLAMQFFVKMILTGKWKDSVDNIGYGRQY